MARDSYWLSQGPITTRELNKAFTYNRRHDQPTDKLSLRHQVAQMRKRYQINRYLKGNEPAGTDPINPWQIAYGSCRTGGTITFIHASTDNQYLHLIVTLAAHEIQMVRKVYFNNYELSWATALDTKPTAGVAATGIFAGLVIMQINYGSDTQSALSVPSSDFTDGTNSVGNKWTVNHRQRGHAHVYLRLKWNATIFKSGLPEFSFLLDGKYDVNDPTVPALRPGSQNPALLLNDYLVNTRWGLAIPQSKINGTRLAAAVATCNEAVALAAGGTETRYEANGTFGSDTAPGQVVDDLLNAMAGRLVYSEGAWSIYAGAGRSTVLTLTEDDILSDVHLLTKTPRADSFNRVRSTYINRTDGFKETDAPLVKNATYVADDNGEVNYDDLTFPLTVSPVAVQRLAKIALERNRQGIVVELTCKIRAYNAEPGEWIGVTFARFGWTAKTFEVMRSALVIEQDDAGVPGFAVRLTLQETAAGVYDWATGNETTVDLSPNTNLPNPFTAAPPSGLTLASGTAYLYLRNDGTVFSRLFVSWTSPADSFVTNGGYTEIQYKKSADSIWQDYGDVPGSSTSAYILDVDDGVSYDVQIRSVNATGVRSSWVIATGHVVQGKTVPPSDVTGFVAAAQDFGIRFVWTPVVDLDLREYEIRIGTTAQTWATAPLSFRVRGDRYYYEFRVAGTYRVRIKAVDTTGNFSTNDAFADVTIVLPSTPVITCTFDGESAVLSWPASTGVFAIKEYELRYGATYASGTPLATVTALRFRFRADWSGDRTFWIVARDVAGNQSVAGTVTATVQLPNAVVGLISWQIDNNVLLDWDVPLASTLPVARYSVFRGGNFLGFVDGTFATYIELVSGFVQFAVRAVDTAGNEGPPQYQNVQVSGPPDFVLFADTILTPARIVGSTNLFVDVVPGSSYYLPVNTTETWTQHYVNNSKTSVQDFINAGIDLWLKPISVTHGEIVWELDLGVTVQQATISFTDLWGAGGTQPAEHVIFVTDRALSTDPWRPQNEFVNSPQSGSYLASNFRYVRVRMTVDADYLGASAAYLPTMRIVVGTKKATDGGIAAVSSADVGSGGTLVNFNRAFLDVIKVTGNAVQSTIGNGRNVIINFADVPNPSSFRILLYDNNGTAISGDVAWDAEGLIAVGS